MRHCSTVGIGQEGGSEVYIAKYVQSVCLVLQCFDAVGWAAGRASDL